MPRALRDHLHPYVPVWGAEQVYLGDGKIHLHLVTARRMTMDGEEMLVVHVEPVPKSR